MKAKFARWVIFSVLLALVPLGFSALARWTRKQPADLDSILSSGELLLVTVGIVGAAVGELIGTNRKRGWPTTEIVAAGMSLLILAVCSLYFADVAAARAAAHVVDGAVVTKVSLVLCSTGVVSSAICVLLSGA